MIPASIRISFDQAKGDSVTVVSLIRGTGAERAIHRFTVSAKEAAKHPPEHLVGTALDTLARKVADNALEWTTGGNDFNLPQHMLRAVVELDELEEKLDALNAFVPMPVFATLDVVDQSDLLLQQSLMDQLKAVLNRRLERARAERDA